MFSDICMWNGMIVEVVVNKNSRLCKQLWLSHLTINQMKSIVFSECWTVPLRVWLRGKKYRPMLNKWVTPFDGADLSYRTNWGQICSFWSLNFLETQNPVWHCLHLKKKTHLLLVGWLHFEGFDLCIVVVEHYLSQLWSVRSMVLNDSTFIGCRNM